MNAKFVSITHSATIADFEKFNKHFKILALTPDEEAALVAEAENWVLSCVQETKVSHDEFGDYALNTKQSDTRLTDFHGFIIIKDRRIDGVVNENGIIKPNKPFVDKWDSWESRAVYYYTDTYTLKKQPKK